MFKVFPFVRNLVMEGIHLLMRRDQFLQHDIVVFTTTVYIFLINQ